MGLDPDFDAVLTAEELAKLDGFDMNWEPGFPGDLYAFADGAALALSRPTAHRAELREGRIVSIHTREFEDGPVAGDDFRFEVYDPTFYTAYHVTFPTVIAGRDGCAAQVVTPDLTAANRRLQEELAKIGADESLEDYDFPEVGHVFAEKVTVECRAAS